MVTATTVAAPTSFENRVGTPAIGSTEFSLNLWSAVRNRGIKPTFTGRLSEDEELRREFLAGSRRMGYELVDLDDREHIAELKAMTPPRYPIQPQQLWMVDALNAEDYDTFTVEVMRRASKTTTIFCWLVGRCESRPGYEVTFSAQSGVSRQRVCASGSSASTRSIRPMTSTFRRGCAIGPEPRSALSARSPCSTLTSRPRPNI